MSNTSSSLSRDPTECVSLPCADAHRQKRNRTIAFEIQQLLVSDYSNLSQLGRLFNLISHDAEFVDSLAARFLNILLFQFLKSGDGEFVERIQSLLTVRPEAARFKDSEGNLPLHHFLESHCRNHSHSHSPRHHHTAIEKELPEAKLLRCLLHFHPESITIPNHCGEMALHIACSASHPDVNLIKILLNFNRDAAKAVSAHTGKLPLHLLLDNKLCKPGVKINNNIINTSNNNNNNNNDSNNASNTNTVVNNNSNGRITIRFNSSNSNSNNNNTNNTTNTNNNITINNTNQPNNNTNHGVKPPCVRSRVIVPILQCLLTAHPNAIFHSIQETILRLPVDGSSPIRECRDWSPHSLSLTSGYDWLKLVLDHQLHQFAFRKLGQQQILRLL